VRGLQQALGDHGVEAWLDSRELRAGDPLWPEIQKAITAASAYTVVVSQAFMQSEWVGDELESWITRSSCRRAAKSRSVASCRRWASGAGEPDSGAAAAG
jgi:hypothetical protein